MTELQSIAERSVIAVTGEDAATFLSGLVTNGPPATGACLSALLTPQGKILFDFTIHKAADGFRLDVHADAAEALMKRLTLYRLRAKVLIAKDEDSAVCIGEDRIRSIAPAGEHPVIAPKAYHEGRIRVGAPEWGADFGSDEVFAMDVNFDLLGGVDYKKGCFVGQEVASRMKRKGEARKRTLIAQFEGPAPEKGTPITAGASTLGSVLSGVDGCALAIVRLDRLQSAKDNDDTITAEGSPLSLIFPPYMANA